MPAVGENGEPTRKGFNFDEFIYKNRLVIGLFLVGFILVGLGILAYKRNTTSDNSVEILNAEEKGENLKVIVEVSGAVENPGVYKMEDGSRIEDALVAAGGVSVDADREWMEKYINRAAKLSDGQKIYIPKNGESLENNDKQSDVLSANNSGGDQTTSLSYSNLYQEKVNINTADAKTLESLWGIGPVYAQNIIEHRPYSKVEDLLEKNILKKNVYDRNKDLMTVY